MRNCDGRFYVSSAIPGGAQILDPVSLSVSVRLFLDEFNAELDIPSEGDGPPTQPGLGRPDEGLHLQPLDKGELFLPRSL